MPCRFDIDRLAAARFALNIADIQEVVRMALGGMRVGMSVEGLERYPINIRYPHDVRDSLEKLRNLPIVTPSGAHIPLAEVADIRIEDGPGLIKTEDDRLNGWIYIDIEGRDLGSYVLDAQQVVAEQVDLPPGYSISWSGQYEFLVRAVQRLSTVVPSTRPASSSSTRSASATVDSDCELIVLRRDDFMAGLRRHPERLEIVLGFISDRLRRTDEFAKLLAYGSAEQRLEFALQGFLASAKLVRKADGSSLLRAGPGDLAAAAGTEEQDALSFLSGLKSRGYCDYNDSSIRFFLPYSNDHQSSDPQH